MRQQQGGVAGQMDGRFEKLVHQTGQGWTPVDDGWRSKVQLVPRMFNAPATPTFVRVCPHVARRRMTHGRCRRTAGASSAIAWSVT